MIYAGFKPEIVPEEAVLVERSFNMYLSGMTALDISKTRKRNEGEAPMYMVENSHLHCLKDAVQSNPGGTEPQALAPKSSKTAVTASGRYSRYAPTEVLQCAECGGKYRRVTWNIRGKKRIVCWHRHFAVKSPI